jgi:L,D-transpeptidase catalytic domain
MVATRIAGLVALVLLVVPASVRAADEHLIVHVHGRLPVFARPGGAVMTTLSSRTGFGSPRVLSVLARSGHWLEVATSDLPDGQDAWINAETRQLTYSTTPLSIRIVLGTRTLQLRSGTQILRAFTVGVGAPATPTPTGQFIVSDKLAGVRFSTAYGCCILALSARQTHLPAGWTGGDEIAIHGTDEPSTIGQAASAGCIHVGQPGLRFLMDRVPLGTSVTIVP